MPMVAELPAYPLALLAGLVSFLSPCVFPLVPAYAAYLGGEAVTAGSSAQASRRVPLALNGLAFVAGFSLVFIAIYYVLRALQVTFFIKYQPQIDFVAGAVVALLALRVLGVIRFTWLMRERKFAAPKTPSAARGFVIGVVFAAGWSPCLSPQLGAILTLALNRNFAGLPFMLVYCLGLALPFLLVALFCDRFSPGIRRLNRHLGLVNYISGALLLVFGVVLMTSGLPALSRLSFASPFNI